MPQLTLQTLIALNTSPDSGNLIDHISNLQLALPDLELHFLSPLEPNRDLGLFRGGPR